MPTDTGPKLDELVRNDRVHRSIYTDEDIFQLERTRIFRRVWLFVGHASQVANAGDYFTTELAGEPVVMTRDMEGYIHVLYNKCPHRGAKVVPIEYGNGKVLQCMYHGWAFRHNGRLAGVPLRRDFPESVLAEPCVAMNSLPRVDEYRGFVFASFNSEVMPLTDYLGDAAIGIDELVERSPVGKIELSGGCHRYTFEGNWKYQLENMADMYHPAATHASTVNDEGLQFKRRPGAKGGASPFFTETGEPLVSMSGQRGYPHGHSSEASLFADEQSGGEIWEEYRGQLVAAYGEDRTKELLRNRRHSMMIFPGLDILIAQTAVRVVKPKSVDRTEVLVYPARLVGAPDELNKEIIQYLNITHSAASFIQSDDLEAFERCHKGLKAGGTDWVLVARGLGQEKDEGNGVLFGDRSSEIGQRVQHYAWRSLMLEGMDGGQAHG